jgi:hypothetical protein
MKLLFFSRTAIVAGLLTVTQSSKMTGDDKEGSVVLAADSQDAGTQCTYPNWPGDTSSTATPTCNTNFCGQGPSLFCGFKFPGTSTAATTLSGQGSFILEYTNSWYEGMAGQRLRLDRPARSTKQGSPWYICAFCALASECSLCGFLLEESHDY